MWFIRQIRAFSFILLIALTCGTASFAQEGQFAVPEPGYNWNFPVDHAAHPDYALEWWYYTGHLLKTGADASNPDNWYHLQLTFFRNQLPGQQSGSLYFAHLAMSGPGMPFGFDEKIARGTLGEAGAVGGVYHVWLDDWSAEELNGQHILHASSPILGEIRLALTWDRSPVLNGEEGYSVKGPGGTEASYYYSMPYMKADGYFTPAGSQATEAVSGDFWMDHEFGNQQLGEGLVGWDWFGLHLPGGDALMIYLIRDRDGNAIAQSAGTWMPATGTPEHLALDRITVTNTGTWTSPDSKTTYPSGWRVQVPSKGIDLTLTPTQLNQELRTSRSTRVTYWEGAVKVERQDFPGFSFGYVELVGYKEAF